MSKSTLDQLHKATDNIRLVAKELHRLSASFYTVGNNKISDQLEDYSQWLFDAVDNILNANTQDLNDQLKAVQATSGALLALALNPEKIRGNNE